MIAKAKKTDLKEISRLFREEYSKSPYNEKWTEETSLCKINEYFKKKYDLFIIRENKKIIGFIIGHSYFWDDGLKGFMDEVVVSAAYQGKGYGKLLIEHLEQYYLKNGAQKITLMSNTLSKAFQIYLKRGYEITENFVQMEKKLK